MANQIPRHHVLHRPHHLIPVTGRSNPPQFLPEHMFILTSKIYYKYYYYYIIIIIYYYLFYYLSLRRNSERVRNITPLFFKQKRFSKNLDL